jgi:hypothetical protein|nr:MAG TPA: hypothetical protein [Crassvirales sp.]
MKINKANDYSIVIIAAFLVIAIIANNINLVINNITLSNKIKAYKTYYNASESLFEEIEDYNENLFDTDKAINYYNAKSKLNNNI